MRNLKKIGVSGVLALSFMVGGTIAATATPHLDSTPNREQTIHVREFANSIGASVTWDDHWRTVTVHKGENTLVFFMDAGTIEINGEAKTIDTPAKIVGGKTMVSNHFLHEVFKPGPAIPAKEVNWSYEGETGIDYWDTLHPEFSTCGNGKEQSPIDIDLDKVKLDKNLEDIHINYSPTPLTVQNTGHTIQANDPTGENTIVVEGEEYTLLQVHFHVPSENTINGKHFDMEGHLVHQNKNGGLAVIGFLIEVGEENKQLEELFSKLPSKKTEKDLTLDQPVDLSSILPKERKTFRFSGSLTTPPCSEGVKWMVLEKPITISQEQLNAYREIFHEDTSRPTQPLYDREVYTH